MSSSYTNMAAGAFLGTCFVAMTLSIVSGAVYDSPNPEKEGFPIKAEQPETAGKAEAKPEVPPIAPLLAKADIGEGEKVFKVCHACHNAAKGGANKIGPDLWGVVGRPIASHEGFSYSSALKKFSEDGKKKWTFELLNHFVHGPRDYVSGTAMTYPGQKDDQKRADVIAYLNKQSDNPLPYPKPEAPKSDDSAKSGDKPADKADDAKTADKGAAEKGATDEKAGDAKSGDQKPADNGADAKASGQNGEQTKSTDQESGKIAPADDNSSGSSATPQPGTEKAPASDGSPANGQEPADQSPSGDASTGDSSTQTKPADENAGEKTPADGGSDTGKASDDQSAPDKKPADATDSQ